jgi:hypothetical protein
MGEMGVVGEMGDGSMEGEGVRDEWRRGRDEWKREEEGRYRRSGGEP